MQAIQGALQAQHHAVTLLKALGLSHENGLALRDFRVHECIANVNLVHLQVGFRDH